MELIKELPEVFEELAEQRQKSFLGIKKLKEQGVENTRKEIPFFLKSMEKSDITGCR